MKNIDLFYAVDGADDDMLMEAEDYFRVRSHRGLRRVALIAAVVALLTMTVYGAYSRIRLRFDEKNDSYWFQDFDHEGIQYTRVTYEYVVPVHGAGDFDPIFVVMNNGDEIMLLPKSGTPVNCTYHFAAPLILSDADHVRLPDGTKLPIP